MSDEKKSEEKGTNEATGLSDGVINPSSFKDGKLEIKASSERHLKWLDMEPNEYGIVWVVKDLNFEGMYGVDFLDKDRYLLNIPVGLRKQFISELGL